MLRKQIITTKQVWLDSWSTNNGIYSKFNGSKVFVLYFITINLDKIRHRTTSLIVIPVYGVATTKSTTKHKFFIFIIVGIKFSVSFNSSFNIFIGQMKNNILLQMKFDASGFLGQNLTKFYCSA